MKRLRLILASLVAALASAAPGQAVAADAVSESTDLPEVAVMGDRLYQMRLEVIKTEERFYALFNDLNRDDDFDVHCAVEAPLGTRIKHRICRVHFYESALAEEARSFLTGDYAPPADLFALERGGEYKQKALAVINAHPELRQLIRMRDALEKEYLAVRKQRFKEHLLAF